MASRTFDRILAPIDFAPATDQEKADGSALAIGDDGWVVISPATVKCLEIARTLAAGGHVELVHATPDPRAAALYWTGDGAWIASQNPDALDGAARERTTAFLQRLAEAHCHGVETSCVVQPGSGIEVILDAARRHPPDAIILASSGRGRVRRAFLGSTADKVIRQAPCPVMVVPPPE
ncbi:MAG: universal stress protein [Myxococcota bacterium]